MRCTRRCRRASAGGCGNRSPVCPPRASRGGGGSSAGYEFSKRIGNPHPGALPDPLSHQQRGDARAEPGGRDRQEAPEEGHRMELQHRPRPGRHLHPGAESPQPGHQRPHRRPGPGHRSGRAGHLHLQGFSPLPDQNQFRRHPQAQGNRAAPQEQLQDGHPDLAPDGGPDGTGEGNHRAELSPARRGKTSPSCWTGSSRTSRSSSR